jgi:hypothetical protein
MPMSVQLVAPTSGISVHAADSDAASAAPNAIRSAPRSIISTGTAPARIVKGNGICGAIAPQNAPANTARQDRCVSQVAIARCMLADFRKRPDSGMKSRRRIRRRPHQELSQC